MSVPSASKRSADKVVNLHLLRGLATLVVVVAHALTRTDSWAHHPQALLTGVEIAGSLAVDTFFVISGFIMIHTSADLFGGTGGAAEFARRRLIRIVPLYWLATAVEVALRARHGNAPPLEDLLRSLFFIPYAAHPGEVLRPIVGVGWTLNYEALFYVLFGLALLLPRRYGLAALLGSLMLIAGTGLLARSPAETGDPTTVFAFLTDRIVLLFGIGVLLGLAYRRGAPALDHAALPFVGMVVLTACTLAYVLSGGGITPSLGWDLALRIAVVAATALWLFSRPITWPLLNRPLSLAGDASYSIYLFHFVLIVAGEKVLLALRVIEPLSCVTALVAGSVLGGTAAYFAVERPVTRALQQMTRRRSDLDVGQLARS